MLLTAFSGTRLNPAEPRDIEFLSGCLTDLSAVLASKNDTRLSQPWRNIFSVKYILSEALGSRNAQYESDQCDELELDSDTEDETWVQDWEVQALLKWMLLEARPAGDELQGLIERLER
ncbi:hypothetical protein FRC01_002972, partial [Tulasnella sp. 417]